MNKDQLYDALNYVNATRESRIQYSNIVLKNTHLIKPLLVILFANDKKISPRAAWIFEFVFKKDYTLIFPYLDYFTINLPNLKLDSAIRPCAKIVELLTEYYYKNCNAKVIKHLNTAHKKRFAEVCFDWMIRDEKVAVKAYSMSSLYYLGKEFDWIHPELKTIMEQGYTNHSAAFRARAKQILKKLK